MEIFNDFDVENDKIVAGRAVSLQRQTWFDLISVRIGLNNALDKVNLIPSPEQLPLFEKKMNDDTKQELQNLHTLTAELEDVLTDLANSVYETSCFGSETTVEAKSDDEEAEKEEEENNENAKKIFKAEDVSKDAQLTLAIMPQMFTQIEKWQRSSSLALKTSKRDSSRVISSTNLAVIDQPFSMQINYVLRDINKVASRFHLNTSAFAPYGIIETVDYARKYGNIFDRQSDTDAKSKYTEQYSKINTKTEVDYVELLKKKYNYEVQETNALNVLSQSNLVVIDNTDQQTFGNLIASFNPEGKTVTRHRVIPPASSLIFCDQEFYAQLLQELAANGGKNPLDIMKKLDEARRKKQAVKKNYEKNVTKNRVVNTKKIHKKLINFMAATPRPAEEELARMRGRLFGKSN